MTAFWNRYPALMVGLSLLAGYSAYFQGPIGLLPLAAIAICHVNIKAVPWRLILAIAVAAAAYGHARAAYVFPSVPKEGLPKEGLPREGVFGSAYVTIDEVKPFATPITKGLIYKGSAKTFLSTRETDLKNIPIHLRIQEKNIPSRPLANRDYWIFGKLLERQPGSYTLVPDKQQPWLPVQRTWSSAEWRYGAKEAVRAYIAAHISDPQAAAFLAGMATGLYDDPYMSTALGRFGVQHIMAISGFHFAIVAWVLITVLSFVFDYRKATFLLLLLLTAYFLFLGPSPSVMRAWVMAALFFGGALIQKNSSALNSLGIALIAVLAYDPLFTQHIGFQFSFLVTAGILFFYAPFDALLQRLFLKRRLSNLMDMSAAAQHGYLGVASLRQALAMALAVNIPSIPLILWTMNKFPLWDLVFNLFFPFLVSLSILLLCVSVLLFPVAAPLHWLNSKLTAFTLGIVTNQPASMDIWIRIDPFPGEYLALYLTALLAVAIAWEVYRERKKQEGIEWQYV